MAGIFVQQPDNMPASVVVMNKRKKCVEVYSPLSFTRQQKSMSRTQVERPKITRRALRPLMTTHAGSCRSCRVRFPERISEKIQRSSLLARLRVMPSTQDQKSKFSVSGSPTSSTEKSRLIARKFSRNTCNDLLDDCTHGNGSSASERTFSGVTAYRKRLSWSYQFNHSFGDIVIDFQIAVFCMATKRLLLIQRACEVLINQTFRKDVFLFFLQPCFEGLQARNGMLLPRDAIDYPQ